MYNNKSYQSESKFNTLYPFVSTQEYLYIVKNVINKLEKCREKTRKVDLSLFP